MFDEQFDLALSQFCEGKFASDGTDDVGTNMRGPGKVDMPICVTVQPPLMSHYYRHEGQSDIHQQGGGYVRMEGSKYIRWSTRMHIPKLIAGRRNFVDQWPDDVGKKE
jgi:hypothetical protein